MYKCMTIIVSYLIVMMQAVKAEQMSVSDLIDRYEATQAKIRAFSAKGVDTGQVIMPDGSTFYYREESVLHSDGDRAHWRCRQWRGLNSADEATPVERATNRVYLWDGDFSYEYRKERDIHGKLFIAGHDKVKKGIISIGYSGAPLMGILEGDLDHVGSILRQAETISVRPEQEQVGKSFCYVIDAVTGHGRYTVWIDPEHGYNIAKAQVHKKQGDIILGKPVGWMGDLSKVRMPGKPKRLRSFSFTLKNIRFEKINGVWVPMEADYQTTNDRTGDVSVRKTHYRRTQVELEPDFDATGAFVPDIPNGTRVWILHAPSIRYEWQDGKVVDSYGNEVDIKTLKPPSLMGKALPNLTQFNLRLNPKLVENKMVLVCFWDMNQRPSRNCIMQLSKRANDLKVKNIVVVAVHASKVDENTLNEWVKKNNIAFPVGMIQGDEEQTRFAWGVKSLPWLILTDKKHIVRAEGFGISELDEKITTLRKK